MTDMYLPNLVGDTSSQSNALSTIFSLEKQRREDDRQKREDERVRLATEKQNALLGLQQEKARLDIDAENKKADPNDPANVAARRKGSLELTEKDQKVAEEGVKFQAKLLSTIDPDVEGPEAFIRYREVYNSLPGTNQMLDIPVEDYSYTDEITGRLTWTADGLGAVKKLQKAKVRTAEALVKEMQEKDSYEQKKKDEVEKEERERKNKLYEVEEGEDKKTYRGMPGQGGVVVATAGRWKPEDVNKAPVVKDFPEGGEKVAKQWDPASKSWKEVSRGPAFAPSATEKEKKPTQIQLADIEVKINQNKGNPAVAGYVDLYNKSADGDSVFLPTTYNREIPGVGIKIPGTQSMEYEKVQLPQGITKGQVWAFMKKNPGWTFETTVKALLKAAASPAPTAGGYTK